MRQTQGDMTARKLAEGSARLMATTEFVRAWLQSLHVRRSANRVRRKSRETLFVLLDLRSRYGTFGATQRDCAIY